ncbi:MAG: phoR2 [Herbinix sp.]|jgi:signal transduction histidine kinase|nr:phoR2 [Herbinix sp.]
MIYISIILFILVVLLVLRLSFLYRSVKAAVKQMSLIEQLPEENQQIKDIPFDKNLELLLKKINELYLARQEERIAYQRREIQIRREIENISHDLRTPLTSILGYVDLIQNDDLEENEKEEYLQIIKKRAKVLQGFIQDFYELSRIEGEDYPLKLEAVTVQTILAETAVAYFNEFEKKNIQVNLELMEQKTDLIADKIQLNRIFNNLIQNALKYSSEIFTIKQIDGNKECILRFQNDKGNLSERELELIFDRFYSGDSSRNNHSTGLGLTITKILVEKMKGSINAYLEEELFVIELRFPVLTQV